MFQWIKERLFIRSCVKDLRKPIAITPVVLKDLKPTDVVVFKFSTESGRQMNNKHLKQMRDAFKKVLKCEILFTPDVIELITVEDKRGGNKK